MAFSMRVLSRVVLLLCGLSLSYSEKASAANQAGSTWRRQGLTEVAYSDPATGVYLGSPTILVLPGGGLLATHDRFAPKNPPLPQAVYVSNSSDGGATWQPLSAVPAYWASPFLCGGSVYLLGTTSSRPDAAVSISRSRDGGQTWESAVLIRPPAGCGFATGSVPVLLAGGYVYRAFELVCGALRWPQSYQALVVYAREGSDLMSPESWAATDPVPFTADMLPDWMPGPVVSGGYLEGNAVQAPDGGVALLLRCRVYDAADRMYTLQHACLFRLEGSAAGRSARLAWGGFVDMPGGGNKFTVRYDAPSGRYLALTNPSVDRYGSNSDARNILVLAQSTNLVDWRVARTLLRPDPGAAWDASLWGESYQYVDWVTDGGDLLAVVRTSTDGANSFHNSNRITFKRWKDYRQWLPDSPQASPATELLLTSGWRDLRAAG